MEGGQDFLNFVSKNCNYLKINLCEISELYNDSLYLMPHVRIPHIRIQVFKLGFTKSRQWWAFGAAYASTSLDYNEG